MSSTDLGNQNITFDFKHPLQGKEFNTLLRGIVKHGIYQGGAVSHDGSYVTFQPFQSVFNSGLGTSLDKTVNITTSSAIVLDGVNAPSSSNDTLLVMRYTWDDVIQNYIDFAYENISTYTVLDTDVVICEITYSGGTTISSLSTDTRTVGIFDSDYNLVVENTLKVDTISERITNTGINIGGSTLFVDQANGRIGINDTTPSYSMDISGTFRVTGTASLAVTNISGLLTLTNYLSVPNGAELTPSIYNTGDANTGIWFPAADTIAISTAGNEAMRIDSSGNVGIGVTPSYKLHVQSASSGGTANSAYDDIVAEGSGNSGITILSGNTSYGSLCFGDSGDGDIGQVTYDHTNNRMLFYTNASEAMRIDSSGNVGIGGAPTSEKFLVQNNVASLYCHTVPTKSDVSFLELVASGSTRTGTTDGVTNADLLTIGSASASALLIRASGAVPMHFSTNSNVRMTIDSSGNVGVNTSNLDEIFNLGNGDDERNNYINIKTDPSSAYAPGIKLGWGSSSHVQVDLPYDTRNTVGLRIMTTSSYPVSIYTNNVERVFISATGAISTNNPTSIGVVAGGIHLEVSATGDAFVVKNGSTEYASITNLGAASFAGGVDAGASGTVLKTKVISTNWNMDTDGTKDVAHGLTHSDIRHVSVLVRRNTDSIYYPILCDASGSVVSSWYINGSDIRFSRDNGSFFDTSAFNNAPLYIYILYEA
ncbi:MAG: hypothetical protein GY853_09770 [PVC group bacterium]|nr:hypothetical protein [PVC group bacterium]